MCGIFGAYSFNGIGSIQERLLPALNTLEHRGPDSYGIWNSPDSVLFLGHRRLAIIDLTTSGHQPMHSASGRYTISFNGEIYNFQILKNELEDEGQKLGAVGDTAVMLAAFEAWGVQKAITKFVGMFAFAVWDAKLEELTIVRDRIGEKPLYYAWIDGIFVFASELTALLKSAGVRFKIDPTALGHLVKFGYIPAPISIFKDVYKLPAAASLTLPKAVLMSKPANFSPYVGESDQSPKKYWNLSEFLDPAVTEIKSEDQYLKELESLLIQSVSQQMIADVPLGAFLSGGIDSSTIVAVMQSISDRPVKTFSIGFEQKSHDEAPFAKAVATHLKTEHCELYVSEKDALGVIPCLPEIFSEPFGDSSQIPTYLVSKLTREKVTASLSGDGGDEVFGGYQRFIWTKKLWNIMSRTPPPIGKMIGSLANKFPTTFLDNSMGLVNNILPDSLKLKNAGFKIQRALSIGSAKSAEDLYLIFLSQKCNPSNIVRGFKPSNTYLASVDRWPVTKDLYTKLMWMDIETYLPDDIFVKVDRASMAVALETRAPFLDHRIVEFAFSLPIQMKIRGSTTKYLLRKLLEKYVPTSLTNRPKMGFGIPVAQWLSGELRPWAEDLLSEHSLSESGLLNEKAIREIWNLHLLGNHSNQYFLWHVLMFQAWLRRYREFIC